MREEEFIIGNLDNTEMLEKVATYYDDRIAIVDKLQDIQIKQSVWMQAVSAILCRKGKASIYINDKLCEIHENNLLLCRPNIIVEHGMMSVDFECYGFLLSPEYINRISLICTNWDAKLFFEKHPIVSLNREEAETFHQYFELLRSKLTGTTYRHQKEVVDSLLQAFLYEFHDSMERFIKLEQPTFSSAEILFRSFIDMIVQSYPKERSVSSYADKLCVTPKYLSTVCKMVSRHTASELINQYVIKDIEYLLKRTDKSIKEIANELNFPNLSFFGKYTKRYLGVSPKQYRSQLVQSETEQP